MAHSLDPQPIHASSADTAGLASLHRYLPTDLASELFEHATPRVLSEAFAHLVSARYAVGTYLPRRLVAHRLGLNTSEPWLEWVDGSLLFTDVSGSTALAERLTSLGREGTEIVTNTLNDYFDRMVQIVQAFGGDLLTFGGDALLVLFSDPAHAHTATAAALELLHELRDFERTVPGFGHFTLTMHIGVASGRVALVSAGRPDAPRYSAMGHAVNEVARAEGYGGKGELVVAPATWQLIADRAEGQLRDEGYMLITGMHQTAAPRLTPVVGTMPQATLAGLAALAGELDQICPYLPPNLVDRIMADPQRPLIEADLRPVTVLFAQVLGLGELVESLDPAQAVAAVDAFLRPMQAAIEQYGGYVNKLDIADEGDKLLAIFGAPVAYEDHAERAARAALAMLALHGEQSEQSEVGSAQFLVLRSQFSLRIGLNTGNVFAGNVGTAERKEYTVMGDAVNVAARVMSKTAWGEIWCSAMTASLIESRLLCEDRGSVSVKGKSDPLPLLRLVGEQALSAPSEAEPVTPLIGRQRELAWLRERLGRAATGQGQAARLVGDAGIGKSRLLAALREEPQASSMRLLHVACLSFATNTPYAPWSELLKDLCGIRSGDPPPTRQARLANALGKLGEEKLAWAPLLAELVGLHVEESPLMRALDPQQRQERRFALIAELLATEPFLVMIDNLHWADQVSLDLWQFLCKAASESALFLLAAHRPGLEWGSGLQGDQAEVLEVSELPDQLVRRAGGNPLFLEELLRAILSNDHDGSGATVNAFDALPDSLNGLLLARIDRLDERSRSLLRLAAVIGQRFPISVLQSIQRTDYQALIGQLLKLDNQELTVMEREDPERVHLFRHALLQEVAYQSLLYARRREIHRQIGEYLEGRYSELIAQWRASYGLTAGQFVIQIGRNGALSRGGTRVGTGPLFLLAHHYRLSDQPDTAIAYLLLAGHAARDAYANDEAIQYYRWAAEALGSEASADPRLWEAREALGDVLCTVGRYDEAQAEYAALLGAQQAHLPPAVAAEVLRSWGDALEKQGRFSEALDKLRQAENIVQEHLDQIPPLMLSAIYADMGLVLVRLGEYDLALAVCTEGLSKVRSDRKSMEDERIEADLHRQVGTIYAMRGDYAQARFHFESALAAQEEMEDYFGASRSHNNIGYLWQLQSDYAKAFSHYARAEELARKVNAKYVLGSVYLNLAYTSFCLNRYAEAEENCRKALPLCEEMGDQLGIAQIYDTYGQIAFHQGEYEESLSEFEQALGIYRQLGSSYQEGNTLAQMASSLAGLGRVGEARTVAETALAIAENIQAPQLRIEALNARAEADTLAETLLPEMLDRAAKDTALAAREAEALGSLLDYGIARRLQGQLAALRGEAFGEHFAASEAIFSRIQNRFELARSQARHGEVLQACNPAAAAAYLEQCQTTFAEIGAGGELRRLNTTLIKE
jgi:adenylate cyclase